MPGIAKPTPRWVEVQGAILHPPAQMQTQGPEQRQDMEAPEDGKIGSWRQTDAVSDLLSPSL